MSVKHGCPLQQQSKIWQNLPVLRFEPATPQGMISRKCEKPLDELTSQVWLLYDNLNFKYYTIIYFYRGKYDGLAPRGKQYSPSPKGEVNIASRGELNHRIYRGKSKLLFYYMNFVKLVFEEHICRINHKETPMTLSATINIWRETMRNVVSTSDEVAIALYFFAQPRF